MAGRASNSGIDVVIMPATFEQLETSGAASSKIIIDATNALLPGLTGLPSPADPTARSRDLDDARPVNLRKDV